MGQIRVQSCLCKVPSLLDCKNPCFQTVQGRYSMEARINTNLTHSLISTSIEYWLHSGPSTLACLCLAQKFPYPQFPCHQRFSVFISWFKFNDKHLKMYQTITSLKILNDIIVYKQLNLNHENRRNWENLKYRRSYSIVKFSKCLW